MPNHRKATELQFQHFNMGSHRIAYTDEGEGSTTVVALHGAPGSVRDLRHIAARLTPSLRVVRLDFAGFGDSLVWEGSYGLSARVDQIAALLDTLGLERVVLLAYSLGGEAAAAFAAAYPDRVSHLALVAPIGPRPHRARRNPVVRIYGSLLRFWPMTPLLRASTSAALRIGGFPKRLKFDEVRETLRALTSVDFAAHGERLASLEIPTLLAWCDDDRWIEPELFRDMAALCPPGPRLHFETGGHALQKTRSEEISNAMLEWLDKEE